MLIKYFTGTLFIIAKNRNDVYCGFIYKIIFCIELFITQKIYVYNLLYGIVSRNFKE